MNNRSTAVKGEQLACEYLKNKGYKIVERNYHCPLGEIDIIAKDKDIVVFIEVKTRESTQYGLPQESIDFRKQKKLINTAKSWIAMHSKEGKGYRFDVIAILREDINHIVNAFGC